MFEQVEEYERTTGITAGVRNCHNAQEYFAATKTDALVGSINFSWLARLNFSETGRMHHTEQVKRAMQDQLIY